MSVPIIVEKAAPVQVDLVAKLLRDGFEHGAPEHITAETSALDRASCRRCKCHQCKRRGLACLPLRKGIRYKVVALCPACGAVEER